jgi:Fe-S-cluster-containing hydrogenase component 2
MARIRVVKVEELGLDCPVACQMCRERYCTGCPQQAITVGDLGQIVVSRELCNGCGTCEELCPIGAIEVVDALALVCDLCGGDPRCVRECNLDAITFDPLSIESVSFPQKGPRGPGVTVEDKRVQWALSRTRELRALWRSGR